MSEERAFDVLTEDGGVVRYTTADFVRILETTSRQEVERLVAEGWLALDELVEEQEPKRGPSAVRQAFMIEAEPPEPPKQTIIYVLGLLREGATGTREV
jgi:hypothetical protein